MNESVDFAAVVEDTTAARQYVQQLGEGLTAVERIRGKAVQLLGSESFDGAWLERVERAVDDLLDIGGRYPDLALYYLVNEKVNNPLQYSALHSVCCALMVVLGAQWLEWSSPEVRGIACAALTMNVAMGELQDQLARQAEAPSPAQRDVIRRHAERGAELLEKAGVSDNLWLQAVLGHHTVHDAPDAEALEPGVRAAELLRRVDVYAARLSTRKTRAALTPAMAARGALLGPSDHPDAMGATLLRVLGLYPPGVYVELVNGEVGVVVERGQRAHTPLVAALQRQEGNVLLVPQARDTALRRFAVRRGVDASQVPARPGHAKVLKSRLQLGLPAALVDVGADPGTDPGVDPVS